MSDRVRGVSNMRLFQLVLPYRLQCKGFPPSFISVSEMKIKRAKSAEARNGMVATFVPAGGHRCLASLVNNETFNLPGISESPYCNPSPL